jgi:antitoxin component HigA of HigAB toxin-antitoxin module
MDDQYRNPPNMEDMENHPRYEEAIARVDTYYAERPETAIKSAPPNHLR